MALVKDIKSLDLAVMDTSLFLKIKNIAVNLKQPMHRFVSSHQLLRITIPARRRCWLLQIRTVLMPRCLGCFTPTPQNLYLMDQ